MLDLLYSTHEAYIFGRKHEDSIDDDRNTRKKLFDEFYRNKINVDNSKT